MVVDADRDRILLRARRFGLFRSERVHPLSGLSAVSVEHGHLKRINHRGSPGDPAGQVRLEYLDGPPRGLTASRLAGSKVHEDLAARLREETALAPQRRPARSGVPASPPAKAPEKRRWGRHLALGR